MGCKLSEVGWEFQKIVKSVNLHIKISGLLWVHMALIIQEHLFCISAVGIPNVVTL